MSPIEEYFFSKERIISYIFEEKLNNGNTY